MIKNQVSCFFETQCIFVARRAAVSGYGGAA